MSVHRFSTTHRLALPTDEAWRFFSDPRNLERITPPEMGFTITSPPPGEMPDEVYPGLIVTYRVRPLLNVPVTWVTEITSVVEGERFVDEQRAGPYAMWHHEHHFASIPGGTEMRDIVHYALPGGQIGDLVNHYVVASRVAEIFAHRRLVLDRLFGAIDGGGATPGIRAVAG